MLFCIVDVDWTNNMDIKKKTLFFIRNDDQNNVSFVVTNSVVGFTIHKFHPCVHNTSEYETPFFMIQETLSQMGKTTD